MMNLLAYPQLALITAMTWVRSRFDARDETGATAVEYGIMVALIAAVIVTIVYFVGQNVLQAFTSTCTGIAKTTKGACA
jgi:pilus assembly protein Flp/PilA